MTDTQNAGAGTLTRQGRYTRPCGTRISVALQMQPSCTASGPAWSSAQVRPAGPLQVDSAVLQWCHLELHASAVFPQALTWHPNPD